MSEWNVIHENFHSKQRVCTCRKRERQREGETEGGNKNNMFIAQVIFYNRKPILKCMPFVPTNANRNEEREKVASGRWWFKGRTNFYNRKPILKCISFVPTNANRNEERESSTWTLVPGLVIQTTNEQPARRSMLLQPTASGLASCARNDD